MVKTQKWYYLYNMRCAYFPINRRLHRERETERERDRKRETARERKNDRENMMHIYFGICALCYIYRSTIVNLMN